MSGFPDIATRDDFGPDMVDLYPPENPETDIGADKVNLLFHQVSGMGLANPARACLIARYDSTAGAFQIFHMEEAWNPRRTQQHPTITRSVIDGSHTVYYWTFPAEVLDRSGASVPLHLVAARASTTSDGTPVVAFTGSDQRQISISGVDGASWDDKLFWVEIL